MYSLPLKTVKRLNVCLFYNNPRCKTNKQTSAEKSCPPQYLHSLWTKFVVFVVFIALSGWRNLSFGRLSAKKMGCINCVFVLIVCRRHCSIPPCPTVSHKALCPRARHTWISAQWKNNKFILSHQKSEFSPPLKSGKKMYACVDKICHSHYFNNSSACAPFFFCKHLKRGNEFFSSETHF